MARPPVVTDELVVAATYGESNGGSIVHAVERKSGDHRWARHIDTSVPWAFAAASGVLYVPTGSPDPGITALDLATGDQRWRWAGRVAGPPTITDSTLYVPLRAGAKGGAVAALDAKTRSVRWRKRIRRGFPTGGFAVADGRIHYSAGRSLEARDASNRTVIWRYGGTDRDPQVNVGATPVVAGGTVYVTGWINQPTSYGHVFAVDAATGDPRGRVSLGRDASANGTVPAITSDLGYVATNHARVFAFGSCGTSLFGRCLVD